MPNLDPADNFEIVLLIFVVPVMEDRLNIKTKMAMVLLVSGGLSGTEPTALPAHAQEAAATPPVLKVSPQSVSAALRAVTANGTRPGAQNSRVHILPTPAARSTLPSSIRNRNNFYGFKPSKETVSPVLQAPVPGLPLEPHTARGAFSKPAAISPFPSAPPGQWNVSTLYPLWKLFNDPPPDNKYGVESAKQVNIYLNCPAHDDSCWGDGKGSLTTFENSFSKSKYITIADQYVGKKGKNRYPLGLQHAVDAAIPNMAPWNTPTLLDSDVQALAYAAASSDNNFGYGFIYHVFIPQGTDVCFDNSFSTCYSPENVDTFYFCGYHGSFDLNGHHILYTVEPYAPVEGCIVSPMSNTDAQVSILGHEAFETITDPDPNLQWNSIYGLGEIADICAWNIYSVTLDKSKYNIQLMYSNNGKDCKAVP